MPRNIDLDRGVTFWRYPKGGMDIFMYKDDPGIYLDAHGREVPEKLAKAAGAPVEKYRKRRMIKEEQAKVSDALKEKYELDAPEVVKEVDGLQLIELPGGLMKISRDGEDLSQPTAREFAVELFEDMAGIQVEVEFDAQENDGLQEAQGEQKGEVDYGEEPAS